MKTCIARRVALAIIATGLWVGPPVAWSPASAQTWPSRPVTIILPFAPGGGTDLLARALAQDLGERFGQQFVVDNRAGAGGNVGAAAVAKAAPDGYTILFGTPGPLANNKLMYKNLPFDPEQAFTPIVLIAKSPLIIAAKVSLPVKDIKELAAYAKANPGKLNVGVPGNGTLGHITSVLLQRELGISMTDVPYRGTALVVNDLLGGQVDLAMDFMPSYVPLVREGKVRALAVTTGKRSSDLPDVNTVQDAGFPGIRGHRLVCSGGARGYAQRDHRQAQRRRQCVPEEPEGAGNTRQPEHAGRRRLPGRSEGLHRLRAAEVGPGGEGGEHRDVTRSGSAGRRWRSTSRIFAKGKSGRADRS